MKKIYLYQEFIVKTNPRYIWSGGNSGVRVSVPKHLVFWYKRSPSYEQLNVGDFVVGNDSSFYNSKNDLYKFITLTNDADFRGSVVAYAGNVGFETIPWNKNNLERLLSEWSNEFINKYGNRSFQDSFTVTFNES